MTATHTSTNSFISEGLGNDGIKHQNSYLPTTADDLVSPVDYSFLNLKEGSNYEALASGTSSPSTEDIVAIVKYTLPPSTAEQTGYRVRYPDGTLRVTDTSFNPQPTAQIVSAEEPDDIIRPVKYTVPPATAEQDGYEVRRSDGTVEVTDLTLITVPGANIITSESLQHVHEDLTVAAGTTSLTLTEEPVSNGSVQITYNGHEFDNGSDFTVDAANKTVDISGLGITWSGNIDMDVDYFTEK